jgi:hypothetical protein
MFTIFKIILKLRYLCKNPLTRTRFCNDKRIVTKLNSQLPDATIRINSIEHVIQEKLMSIILFLIVIVPTALLRVCLLLCMLMGVYYQHLNYYFPPNWWQRKRQHYYTDTWKHSLTFWSQTNRRWWNGYWHNYGTKWK